MKNAFVLAILVAVSQNALAASWFHCAGKTRKGTEIGFGANVVAVNGNIAKVLESVATINDKTVLSEATLSSRGELMLSVPSRNLLIYTFNERTLALNIKTKEVTVLRCVQD